MSGNLLILRNRKCAIFVPMNRQTLFEVRRHFVAALQPVYSLREAEQLWRMLLEDHFGIDRVTALSEPEMLLEEEQLRLVEYAENQLNNNIPIQYVLGMARFMDLRLKVDGSVLIPRPETEEMVRHILESRCTPPRHIWDIGTGSGCIALALKKAFPNAEVYAFDISPKALMLARQNAEDNQLKINFIECDILQPQSDILSQPVDLVVSNPPYVCQSERADMLPNVLDWEPEQALFVPDNDPLLFYRAILRHAQSQLTIEGAVWFEINEAMGAAMKCLCADFGFAPVEVHRDFREKERFLSCGKSRG